MCGICGQYNYGKDDPIDPMIIQRMMDSISHRGPDDSGMHIAGPVGLGFRRLSILDLSSAGHQPMSDPAKSVWVIFNGEIYNFRELRKELEEKGHVFASNADTEVIVHGYKQWGDAVLERFNGMFGLAIWDASKKRLLLARDPMGIKPLYFALIGGSLVFGSEIRPIRAALSGTSQPDYVGINLFLRYRYVPAPYTAFEGIRKLAPGEALVIEGRKCSRWRYYDYSPQLFESPPSLEEAGQELLSLYKAAVKRHLISDVPVGLLLSGGVDSGMLLGLMNMHGSSWPTFTIGYGVAYRDDELDDAAATARLFGAKHVSITLDRQQFEQSLPHIVNVLEEPVTSSSIIPMFFVSQRARQDVKVALIGQGPDELLGGYKRHIGIHYGRFWRSLPHVVRTPVEAMVSRIPRNETAKRGVGALSQSDPLRRYQEVFSILPGQQIDSLFQPGSLPPDIGDRVIRCWQPLQSQMENLDELGGFQLIEIRSALPDELLMYADKLSMVHALEVRVPYLDREVVEYAQRLPASFKVAWGKGKIAHRRACRRILPNQIIARRKRGFGVNVVDDWFRSSMEGNLQKYLSDPESLMFKFLNHGQLQVLLREHQSNRHNHYKILFSLAVLEVWLRALK